MSAHGLTREPKRKNKTYLSSFPINLMFSQHVLPVEIVCYFWQPHSLNSLDVVFNGFNTSSLYSYLKT